MNTDKNVMQVGEEDRAFIRYIMLLSPEKRSLIRGIIIGMNLQEKKD